MKSKNRYSKHILFLAIIMMISSALISYFYVRQNETKIASLKIERQNKEMLIRDIWDNIGKRQNNANIAILISIFSEKNIKNVPQIKKRYLENFQKIKENSSVLDILDEVENEKKENIEQINNIYLDQIAIQNNISAIEMNNKLYSDIAFFFQVLSVVLIIIRRDIIEQ